MTANVTDPKNRNLSKGSSGMGQFIKKAQGRGVGISNRGRLAESL